MLTKKDLFLIGEVVENIINVRVPEIVERIVEPKFEEFAILMQNEFRAIHEEFRVVHEEFKTVHGILATKANKVDTASKTDITRLENKFEGRIEKVEDNMRIVKTTLKLT
ncbi:MAG: hypothetical protein ACOYOI_07905 [Chthoniobacterales bacterium]